MMCIHGSNRKEGGWRLVKVMEAAAPGEGDEEEEPEPCPRRDMGIILSGGVNPVELRAAQKQFDQGTCANGLN